jgi:hypothetical protein
MGMRKAVGRYTHETILPNQFTSSRENPKSRTTKERSVITNSKNSTVVALLDMGPNHGQLAAATASSINYPPRLNI